ncbi:LytTR family transcriptional regulator DNA-binding domain-containing protein [Shouchella clausii]|uniref:LytTR family transcriptional regulator DNA-binding domain-containing protein n=1 Tax=Shouchella clausii TaxID=79880 RepID=UPI00226CCDF6|nr:LytTR family transcriptional regulator DNA-binding domain-containing protein [Shouchella clausii]MCY1103578.1 LytTR family transcriptional regulator DNA-binding domain-containing protein [Shouchella clausii]
MFEINLPSKIAGNRLLLPEINVAVQPGQPVAIQGEAEFLQTFLSQFMNPFSGSTNQFKLEDKPFDPHSNAFMFHQSDGLYKRLTPREVIRFWLKLYKSEENEKRLLAVCELSEVADKRVRSLPLSERRRLHFCRRLIMPSQVYVFDQPTLHVDRQTKHVFHTILEMLSNKCIVITTTSLEEAIQLGTAFRMTEHSFYQVEQTSHDQDASEAPKGDAPLKLAKISAKMDDKIILFDPLEIDYMESQDGQTILHVNSEAFFTSIPLKDLEQRLAPFGFFRCHRSYLVNLQRVREIIVWSKNSYSLSLNDQTKNTIPLSKGNYAALKELLQM